MLLSLWVSGQRERTKKKMIQAFENIDCEDLGDLVAGGWSVVSAGKVSIDGGCSITDVVVVPNSSIENIYSGAIYLSGEDSELYIIPTASAGELFLGIMAFLLFSVMILKWIGSILFRMPIDFKNRS